MTEFWNATLPVYVDEFVEQASCHWYTNGHHYETADTDWRESLRQDVTGPIARLAIIRTNNVWDYVAQHNLPITLVSVVSSRTVLGCGSEALRDEVFVAKWPSVVRSGALTKRCLRELTGPHPEHFDVNLCLSSPRPHLVGRRHPYRPLWTIATGITFWFIANGDFFDGMS